MNAIVTKKSFEKDDGMKTNELIEALDRISRDKDTLIERGAQPDEIDNVLSILGTQLTAKVSGAMNILSQYESLASAAKQRASAIMEVAKSYENKAASLREYLKYAMRMSGIKKIEGEHYSITHSITKNGAVDVFDENQIPSEYVKTVTTTSIDKRAIAADIKDGKEIAGVRMIETEKIIIKGA